jgi:regulator of sigma E protease
MTAGRARAVSAVTLVALAAAGAPVFAQVWSGQSATVLSYVLSFIVALGILIFIHELGHFLVAKALGVGVERFSLGFGPRIWTVRGRETEYCVSAIPLGGYVKMVGEEAHGEELIHPSTGVAGAARDFRADPARSFALRPLWQRALIVFAGPGMNFALAALIFAVIFASVGVFVVPAIIGRVMPDSPAAEAGLRPGDTVVAIDGVPVDEWSGLQARVQRPEGRPLRLTVVRDGVRREVAVTPRRMPSKTVFGEPTEAWGIGASPYVPPVVGEVRPGMPAEAAGLRPGDRVVAIDGQPVETWEEMAEAISRRAGQPVELVIERGGQRTQASVVPAEVADRDAFGRETRVGRIGIGPAGGEQRRRLDPFTAVVRGVERTGEMSLFILLTLWKLVTGVVPASTIGGPIQIGMVLGQAAQDSFLTYFLWMAGISVNLAVLNLLPVPMLDGGHLLFFAIEAVLGRPLSERKREVAQQVGLALLLLLMVFALGNDILRYLPLGQLFR